jgi:hypothetical protein
MIVCVCDPKNPEGFMPQDGNAEFLVRKYQLLLYSMKLKEIIDLKCYFERG